MEITTTTTKHTQMKTETHTSANAVFRRRVTKDGRVQGTERQQLRVE